MYIAANNLNDSVHKMRWVYTYNNQLKYIANVFQFKQQWRIQGGSFEFGRTPLFFQVFNLLFHCSTVVSLKTASADFKSSTGA